MTYHNFRHADPPVTRISSASPPLNRIMRRSITCLIGILAAVTANSVHAQITVTELQSPYSFISNQAGQEYFISSVNGDPDGADNNGFITKLDASGKIVSLKFIQGGKDHVTLNAPKGMVLVDHILYVADLDTVRGFDASTGKSTIVISLSDSITNGASRISLTDVTFDGKGLLYCSDQKADRIYRIDLASRKASVLIADPTLAGPAGLAVHPKSGHLIAVSWDKGKIFERLAGWRSDRTCVERVLFRPLQELTWGRLRPLGQYVCVGLHQRESLAHDPGPAISSHRGVLALSGRFRHRPNKQFDPRAL